MRQVDRVVFVLKVALPRQGVVVARILPLHRVLVVADVVSAPDPALARLLGCFHGVHQRPHAAVVQRVWLDQVDHIEAVVLADSCV